jgi:crossover junction endodeoxyribonuclease RuvC
MGKEPDKVVLGIDPGTKIMGYGVIHINGNKTTLLDIGVLDMQHLDDHALKLKHIFENTLLLIDKHKPDEVSLEAPFFGKNVQSMLKLGRAQGVAIAAALHRSLPIFEYSPKKIKMSITGNGNASKEQVAAMLKNLLSITEMPKFLDATDGLAAAMCHFFQNGKPASAGKSYSGWKSFLTANPSRKG